VSTLWEGFQRLRKVRNSYVHEGAPKIGKQVIDHIEVALPVANARQVVGFLENLLLPQAHQDPGWADRKRGYREVLRRGLKDQRANARYYTLGFFMDLGLNALDEVDPYQSQSRRTYEPHQVIETRIKSSTSKTDSEGWAGE